MADKIYNFRRGDIVNIARFIEHNDELQTEIEWVSSMHSLFISKTPGVVLRVNYLADNKTPVSLCVLFADRRNIDNIDYWNFLIECFDLVVDPEEIKEVRILFDVLNDYPE